MRSISITVVALVALLAGCAVPTSSGPHASTWFTPPAECDRNSGAWRAQLDFCEYPSAP